MCVLRLYISLPAPPPLPHSPPPYSAGVPVNFIHSGTCDVWHGLVCADIASSRRRLSTEPDSTDPASLSLNGNNLASSSATAGIPHQIGGLTALGQLDLGGNAQLAGTVPTQLGAMVALSAGLNLDGDCQRPNLNECHQNQ